MRKAAQALRPPAARALDDARERQTLGQRPWQAFQGSAVARLPDDPAREETTTGTTNHLNEDLTMICSWLVDRLFHQSG